MIICAICKAEWDNYNGLGKHIFHSHKEITKQEYYNLHINHVSPICCCGIEKKFRSLGEGYRTFCSVKCRSTDTEWRKKNSMSHIGKIQTKETIEKRIRNTNQEEKEISRKSTMIERYGVDNAALVPEFISKMRIRVNPPPKRTEEHSKNIIEAKKQNGTLKHSNSTRTKIQEGLNKYYQIGNNQSVTVSKLPSNGRGHKTGFYNSILYRSSWELLFILWCENKDIVLESCENKEKRVRYNYNGKQHWYYPDFYLPKYDVCIEIKPTSMMNEIFEIKKKYAQQKYKNYVVITEIELADEETLYEYIHSFA